MSTDKKEGTPIKKCGGCNGLGWWCRGCGGARKKSALEEHGLTEEDAEGIWDEQFGECDPDERVPCYICNFDGTTVPGKETDLVDFWTDRLLSDEEEGVEDM